jgi:phosphoribosylaminoimidazole-succinocarboxamide synthase
MTTRGEKLYEGKAKALFATDDPQVLWCHFKDEATAFDGLKKGIIGGKGEVNCGVTARIFQLLAREGIPTHYVGLAGPTDMLVKKVHIVPIEVVVRNRIAGSLARRYGLQEGPALPRPLLELFYKSDPLHDPLMMREHALLFGWSDAATLDAMEERTLKVNTVLSALFSDMGIDLVDFKLEWGLTDDGELLLADEFSPDGCRLWDRATGEKLDKDRFRRDLGNVSETYQYVGRLVAERLPL